MRILIVLFATCAACASAAREESPPGADRGDPGAERPLHPFYDRAPDATGTTTQVRPLWWYRSDDKGKSLNVLGPIFRWRDTGKLKRLRILPNILYMERTDPEAHRNWWFNFFPILFLGTGDALLFPVAGYSNSFFGIDDFLLVTPLYFRSRRFTGTLDNRIPFTTHNLLLGLVAWGSDGQPDGRRRFRVIPLFGKTHARCVDSGFVLWPLFNWKKGERQSSWHLWPLLGRGGTYDAAGDALTSSTTVAWPFFHLDRDFASGATDVALWPLVRYADGSRDKYVRRLWPLYEFRRVDNTTTEIIGWPFWRRTWRDSKREQARYTWVVPFYTGVQRYRKDDGVYESHHRVWPVARWERADGGGSEVLFPAILPFRGRSLREYFAPLRPFTSLYWRRTAPDGEREASALFGLVQSRRSAERKKVRILGGLVGWDRKPSGRELRLLWFLRLPLG